MVSSRNKPLTEPMLTQIYFVLLFIDIMILNDIAIFPTTGENALLGEKTINFDC